jgi:hypothetical protein
MIRPALTLSLALLIAACGGNDADTANDAVADVGLEQEDVITNDVTAIDAATADAAGMAADMAPPSGNELDDNTGSAPRRERRPGTAVPANESDAPEPADSEEPEPALSADNAA